MPHHRGLARRTVAVVLVACALALGACGGSIRTRAASVSVPDGGATLPARFVGTEIVVLTTINGTGPYPLLLDTGAEVGMLTPDAARAAGVRPHGSVGTRDAHGVGRTEAWGKADVTAYGYAARNLPFTIKDLPQSILDKHGIVGILGYNAFADTTLVLDYPNERISVTDDRADAGSPAAVQLRHRYGDLPFALGGVTEGQTSVVLPWQLLLDTGSDLPMTLGDSATRLYADKDNARALFASMSSTGSVMPVAMARLKEDPVLGATRVERVTAEVGVGVDSIGHPLLSRFKVTIDPVANVVLFEHPEGATRISMPTWRGHGFTAGYEQGRGYVVAEVYAGSPAERGGLLAGDAITAIDGVSMLEHPEAWPGLTDDPDLTHRAFDVTREDEHLTLTLELADILPEPTR